MPRRALNSVSKTVEQLFASRFDYYEVPKYQRSFNWEDKHFQQFWDDIIFALERPREGYFMGAIVLKERGEHKIEIIDGQQRLSAITILLAIIGKKLIELEHIDEGRDIIKQFIVDERRDRRVKKLILNKENRSFFEKYIHGLSEIDPQSEYNRETRVLETNKKIFKAYKLLEKKISKYLERESSTERKINLLLDLADCVRENLEFIVINTHEDTDAYIIFETLNAKGEELSTSDLLKNYLFSKAEEGDYLDEVIDFWEDITNTLSELSNLSEFLRHYWISKEKLVREKDLYRELKSVINSGREAFNFINKLKEEAKIYEGIINPNSNLWSNDSIDNKIKDLIKELKILGIKQCRPLLLASFISFSRGDFKKIIELVVNLSFRFGTICNLNPNDLENLYGKVGREIRNNKINTVSQIKREFTALYPNDTDFSFNFVGKIIRRNDTIPKYILRKINDYMRNNRELATPDITLEHIIPKTLNTDWVNYLNNNGLSHQELLFRIGNMSILSETDNRSASNKFFTLKKEEIYKDSVLPINQGLLIYDEWNNNSIKDREEKMFEIAREIWKL